MIEIKQNGDKFIALDKQEILASAKFNVDNDTCYISDFFHTHKSLLDGVIRATINTYTSKNFSKVAFEENEDIKSLYGEFFSQDFIIEDIDAFFNNSPCKKR